MTNVRKCPKCHGKRRVLDARCPRCNGFGRIVQDEIVSFQPEVEAMFLLKDGTVIELKLKRELAQTYMMLNISGRPKDIPCTLHHIDQDGIFHYEEA